MKSNWIDQDNIEEYEAIISFMYFLHTLGIKSAYESLTEVEKFVDREFCDTCRSPEDHCECADYEKYGGRYCREYDDGADYED